MEKEFLLAKHFKKLITCQPFFIWHSLENKEEELENDELNHFWTKILQENKNTTFAEVATRTISKLNKWLQDLLLSNYKCIIIKGTLEEKIKQTKKYLNTDLVLINPVFEFKNCLAKPFAFNLQNKEIIYIKYSKKTKISDLINPYWDFNIIKENININKISLFLPQDKLYKKGEIDLYPIDRIHITKNGQLPFKQNSKGELKDVNILEFINNPKLKTYIFPDFKYYINKIKKAKKEKKVYSHRLIQDNTPIGNNLDKVELLKKLNFPYAEWNGNVIKYKDIINFFETQDESIFSSKVFDKLKHIKETFINDKNIKEINILKKSKKIIWYDFEGYSLPYAPIDYVSPYSQVVFQLSLIETIDNKETMLKNIVIDPLKININDLYNIIVDVYSNDADAYVVYNKGYELARMKEIIKIMILENHSEIKKAQNMLDIIESKTVDLMNIFKVKSKNIIPPILLNDQFAKASIKNIEKHISKNKIILPRPIKEYKNLDIQNGMMAMNAGIERAIGLTGDNEWNIIKKQLKEYCENDVRAMIMVYDFVLKLLNK